MSHPPGQPRWGGGSNADSHDIPVIHCPNTTVDGFVEEGGAIWEAKHANAFANGDEALERYMPQLQHNMAVAGAERAFLSVIFGNHKFEVIEVAAAPTTLGPHWQLRKIHAS